MHTCKRGSESPPWGNLSYDINILTIKYLIPPLSLSLKISIHTHIAKHNRLTVREMPLIRSVHNAVNGTYNTENTFPHISHAFSTDGLSRTCIALAHVTDYSGYNTRISISALRNFLKEVTLRYCVKGFPLTLSKEVTSFTVIY